LKSFRFDDADKLRKADAFIVEKEAGAIRHPHGRPNIDFPVDYGEDSVVAWFANEDRLWQVKSMRDKT